MSRCIFDISFKSPVWQMIFLVMFHDGYVTLECRLWREKFNKLRTRSRYFLSNSDFYCLHPSLRAESFLRCVMIGMIKSRAAVIKKTSEMGREMKIEKSPRAIINDRRRFVSSFCPRTKARIKGAPSYRNFFIRNPKIPKMSMAMTSEILFSKL